MKALLSRRVLPVTVGLTAGVFLVLYVIHFTVVQSLQSTPGSEIYLDTIVLGIPVVVLSGGAVYFWREPVADRYVPRVLGWCYGGSIVTTVTIVVTVFVAGAEFDAVEPLVLGHAAGGLGSSIGFVMGVLEWQALRQDQARARAEWEARQSDREREQVKLLNKYLRHEVLNGIQVINANAQLVSDRVDRNGDIDRRIEVIRDRSADVGQFVQSIRRILDASDFTLELDPVDVTAVVSSELEKVELAHDHLLVSPPECTGSVHVQADSLVSTVFTNLFENAVEHNDGPITLDVSIDRTGDTVVVTVADDGSGIAPNDRTSLFEPADSGDHGYGLFLTRTLLQLYDGSISLVEAGESGTVFEVTFLAAPQSDDEPRATRVAAE